MARGAEAKLRRRNQKKEARKQADEMLSGTHDFGAQEEEQEELPMPASNTQNDTDSEEEDQAVSKKAAKAMKNRSQNKQAAAAAAAAERSASKGGIKTMPLVLLVLLTGTTLLPAVLYMGDWIGNFAQEHHVLGQLGYKLGVGATPKMRVLSFYEKHDPNKIPDVPKILSKHYGDYPLLIKKLERKYQDYGYFLGWEQDEAPMTVAFDKLLVTRDAMVDQFYMHAPQPVKTAATNVKYNLTKLYKRAYKLWKRKIWPLLEPIVGVPKGGAAQKRKDARAARERRTQATGTRRKNTDFRDDDDEED